MNFTAMAFFTMLENVAIVAGSTVAAIHFQRPALLFFYLLVLANQRSFSSGGKTNGKAE